MRPALLLTALLLAGCAAPPPPPADVPTLAFGHEHASFGLFLLGERVAFNHTDYDLATLGQLRAHLHVGEQHGGQVVHLEGLFPAGAPNVTLADFLGILGLRFAPGTLTLDTRDHHNGTTWNDTAAARWQVWVEQRNSTVMPLQDAPAHVLRDGQRVLLSYAPPGSSVFGQLQSIPEPPPGARPGNATG